MLSFYWSTLTIEDKVATVSFFVSLFFLLVWLIVSNTSFGDKESVVEFEARIWRKHGVSITGLFVILLIVIVMLYGVWLLLGEL